MGLYPSSLGLRARASLRSVWRGVHRALPAAISNHGRERGSAWPEDRIAASDFRIAVERANHSESRIRVDDLSLVRSWAGTPGAAAERQLSEGYKARPDAPPFPIQLPLDWNADPFRDANWRSQLHMLRLIDPFLRAHDSQAGSNWLRVAFDIVLDWHRHVRIHGRQEHVAWRDMMVGVRSLRLAYLFEQIRIGALAVTSTERDALCELSALHAKALTAPGFFRYTNHTVWDLHGLTALLRVALPDDTPRAAAWLDVIGSRLDFLVDLQFDEHGVHRENSPQYHSVVRNMFDVLLDAHWYDAISTRLVPALAAARRLQPLLRLPDGRQIAIGDSDGMPPTSVNLPGPKRSDVPLDLLNHSCYGFVRQVRSRDSADWSQLAIKAGFDLPGHKHEDVLSYLWSESGCDIVIDPGKYAYDNTPMRRYMRSNRAHNLIEFDGRDSDVHADHRTGHCLAPARHAPWGVLLRAALTHQPNRVRHERAYYFAPGRWLLLVDRFQARRAVRFRHFTHLAPEFTAASSPLGFQVEHSSGRTLGIHHWASVKLDLTVIRGQQEPDLQGWISRAYREAIPCPTLVMSGHAAEAVTVLALTLEDGAQLEADGTGPLAWVSGADRIGIDVASSADGMDRP